MTELRVLQWRPGKCRAWAAGTLATSWQRYPGLIPDWRGDVPLKSSCTVGLTLSGS